MDMYVCPKCGRVSSVGVTHFESGKNPSRYKQCNNKKCRAKSKEKATTFDSLLKALAYEAKPNGNKCNA